ncbi:hypothetical protein HanPI659440_Chr17g0690781 [Helianthus annuus]|nr:hypothetical protein HanPI659440_Chr17g0690781 [Helianthus annuus]
MTARVPAKVQTSEDEPLVTTKKPWRSLTNFWCEFESRMQSVSIQCYGSEDTKGTIVNGLLDSHMGVALIRVRYTDGELEWLGKLTLLLVLWEQN